MAAVNIKPKKVASGAFGSVYNPAFKNKNSIGQNILYPDEVTKIYFKKSAYDKALQDAEKVKMALGENTGIAPYRHKYKLSNLNTITRENIAKIKRNSGEKNLIHGDIREVNIMIHPQRGKITIIDFDALTTRDDYFDKQTKYTLALAKGIKSNYPEYNAGLYQLPPEFLIKPFLESHFKQANGPVGIFPWKQMYSIPKVYASKESGSISPLITHNNIDDIVALSTINILHRYYKFIKLNYDNKQSNVDFNRFLVQYLNTIFAETADSYGLAGGLLCLLASVEQVYKDKIYAKQRDIYKKYLLTDIKDIILAMASPDYRYRISPEQAYELILPLVENYIEEMKGASNNIRMVSSVNSPKSISGSKRSRSNNSSGAESQESLTEAFKKGRLNNTLKAPLARQNTLYGGKRKTVRRKKSKYLN